MARRIESRQQAIDFLYSRIDYERISASLSASDFKLDRMKSLLARLDDPHEITPVVHVAGTKGKGSTSAMIASVLQAAGYRTGLFTSPHLEVFEERIRIDGELIDETSLVRLTSRLAEVTAQIDSAANGLSPTFFELTTALAWMWFAEQQVDIAVLEVGLGGRLDSTNICRPLVCLVTTISRDHTHILGHRLSEIAAEKAGIIKPGVPVISGVRAETARAVIVSVAAEQTAPLKELGEQFGIADQSAGHCVLRRSNGETLQVKPGIPGAHQAHNAALAVAAIDELRTQGMAIPDESIVAGMRDVYWPLRVEIIRQEPVVLIDSAHNWASADALIQTVRHLDVSGRRLLIFATSSDKDTRGLLRRLIPVFDTVIVTRFTSSPRSNPPELLVQCAAEVSSRGVHQAENPADAWQMARRLSGPSDLICAAGSFFLAAEIRSMVLSDTNSVCSQ